MQQGDVLICQTPDGGDIEIKNGLVTMTGGLDTAAYLSLFGGNAEGSEWWGNLSQTETAKKYSGELEALLEGLPATSRNLRRVEETAKRLLKWFIDVGAATEITVDASIPEVNKLKLTININAEAAENELVYVENWRASA